MLHRLNTTKKRGLDKEEKEEKQRKKKEKKEEEEEKEEEEKEEEKEDKKEEKKEEKKEVKLGLHRTDSGNGWVYGRIVGNKVGEPQTTIKTFISSSAHIYKVITQIINNPDMNVFRELIDEYNKLFPGSNIAFPSVGTRPYEKYVEKEKQDVEKEKQDKIMDIESPTILNSSAIANSVLTVYKYIIAKYYSGMPPSSSSSSKPLSIFGVAMLNEAMQNEFDKVDDEDRSLSRKFSSTHSVYNDRKKEIPILSQLHSFDPGKTVEDVILHHKHNWKKRGTRKLPKDISVLELTGFRPRRVSKAERNQNEYFVVGIAAHGVIDTMTPQLVPGPIKTGMRVPTPVEYLKYVRFPDIDNTGLDTIGIPHNKYPVSLIMAYMYNNPTNPDPTYEQYNNFVDNNFIMWPYSSYGLLGLDVLDTNVVFDLNVISKVLNSNLLEHTPLDDLLLQTLIYLNAPIYIPGRGSSYNFPNFLDKSDPDYTKMEDNWWALLVRNQRGIPQKWNIDVMYEREIFYDKDRTSLKYFLERMKSKGEISDADKVYNEQIEKYDKQISILYTNVDMDTPHYHALNAAINSINARIKRQSPVFLSEIIKLFAKAYPNAKLNIIDWACKGTEVNIGDTSFITANNIAAGLDVWHTEKPYIPYVSSKQPQPLPEQPIPEQPLPPPLNMDSDDPPPLIRLPHPIGGKSRKLRKSSKSRKSRKLRKSKRYSIKKLW